MALRAWPPTPCCSAPSAGRSGTPCPTTCAPRRACCACARIWTLFANLRPAICYPALADASSLKREIVEGLDIMIVRELTGGVYFGEPKEIIDLGNGQKRGVDTQVYDTYEIERIGRVAFELARKRGNKVTSAEKRNVMKSGVLWNEVVTALHKREYADVKLEHMLADACAMQLVRWPKQFDVIVTDNLFGDMLSDVAAMLTGSLGMLPSASLGEPDAKTGKRKALYEPVHGSAPDIAGKGIANPIAMIALVRHGAALFLRPRRRGRHGSTRRSPTCWPRACARPTSRATPPAPFDQPDGRRHRGGARQSLGLTQKKARPKSRLFSCDYGPPGPVENSTSGCGRPGGSKRRGSVSRPNAPGWLML